MILARSASGSHRDRRAAVAALFGGCIVGRDFIFLHVIRSESIEIADWIGHRRFVRLDSVDGYVVGAVTRSINMHA